MARSAADSRSTRRTVLVAGAANVVVAAAKLAAGLMTGSSDLRLAEKLPVVPHVFIDPTQTSPGRDPAARQ
jgi:hypothetical protein